MSKLVPVLLLVVALAAACGDNELPAVARDAGGSAMVDAGLRDGGPVPMDAGASPDALNLACTLQEVQPIITCATTNCFNLDAGLPLNGDGGIDPTQILTCVTLHCGLLVFGLPASCRNCVLSGLSGLASGSFSGTVAACLN